MKSSDSWMTIYSCSLQISRKKRDFTKCPSSYANFTIWLLVKSVSPILYHCMGHLALPPATLCHLHQLSSSLSIKTTRKVKEESSWVFFFFFFLSLSALSHDYAATFSPFQSLPLTPTTSDPHSPSPTLPHQHPQISSYHQSWITKLPHMEYRMLLNPTSLDQQHNNIYGLIW